MTHTHYTRGDLLAALAAAQAEIARLNTLLAEKAATLTKKN